MKKAIILILIFASLLCFNVRAHLGSFYDGTGSRDSVWIPVATFDTLGYELNADSLWVWRFFRADTIDMTVKVSNDSTRRGYFLFGKRAVDSTAEGKRYGGYTVKIRWKVQGKYFHKSESYTVFPDSVTGVGRVTTLGDKTGYTATLSDKSDYLLKADSNVVARAPWDNDLIAQANRRIQYADSLGEEITGGSATNPDTIANHVWIWGTRTLTSGSGSGTNQVTVYTFQSSDSTPIEDV
ncbi:MAG: hypothetical protein OEV55_06310, partial [candidate division Zixibacteria bacterium]|nr:hypothetical protein [candidate division Zixibacteria bacterium]